MAREPSTPPDMSPTTASAMQPTQRAVRIAVAGLGVGSKAVLKALRQMPQFQVVAAADVREEARRAFRRTFDGHAHDRVEGLCADADVDVVWVSTPNHLHCEHTLLAARAGKHVIVEKPMAIDLDEAERMVTAARENGVQLMCGHTASLRPSCQAMRQIVTSGELGRLCAMNVWSHDDWLLRPRMEQELDLQSGGGIVYRQGPHQVDTVRLLGGGMVRSVRAVVGAWMPRRPAPGYYAAFLEFENGVPATIVKNGYGYFSNSELVPWAVSSRTAEERGQVRQAMKQGAYDDAAEKRTRRFGAGDEQVDVTDPDEHRTAFYGDLGLLIATFERGDVRQSPNGVWVYDDGGRREVAVEGLRDDRMNELDEMYNAIVEDRPVRHDGLWGMATLEVALAFMQSSEERREVYLSHQCPAY